jgi:hypothetical protein
MVRDSGLPLELQLLIEYAKSCLNILEWGLDKLPISTDRHVYQLAGIRCER